MSEDILVEVWLPLKSYKLQIKHRILAELGELSHFVLNSMNKYGLTIAGVYNVTGLSENQLKPVIERLQGLKFISETQNLTDAGNKVAYVLAHLHNKEIEIYMDQNYNSRRDSWFMTLSDADCLQEIPMGSIKVELPGRIRYDFVEDCFLQSQRFQRNTTEYLPLLVPEFDSFVELSGDRWGLEWDISFRSNRDPQSKGLMIELPLKQYDCNAQQTSDKNNPLRLYTPVLQLTTSFSLPVGFDWQDKSGLNSISCVYSEHDSIIYDEISIYQQYGDGTPLTDHESVFDDDIAYKLLEYTHDKYDHNPLYSTEHKFATAWQLHKYAYSEIVENIAHKDVIKGR